MCVGYVYVFTCLFHWKFSCKWCLNSEKLSVCGNRLWYKSTTSHSTMDKNMLIFKEGNIEQIFMLIMRINMNFDVIVWYCFSLFRRDEVFFGKKLIHILCTHTRPRLLCFLRYITAILYEHNFFVLFDSHLRIIFMLRVREDFVLIIVVIHFFRWYMRYLYDCLIIFFAVMYFNNVFGSEKII